MHTCMIYQPALIYTKDYIHKGITERLAKKKKKLINKLSKNQITTKIGIHREVELIFGSTFGPPMKMD